MSSISLVAGIAMYDLLYKLSSLGITWLFVREQPEMMWMVIITVAIGYSGSFAGLFAGARLIKELRHAGIVRQ
jgi:energy-coupling factor transport system substrate-specific component